MGTTLSTGDDNSCASYTYLGRQGQAFNSYVTPWAQAQAQAQAQSQPQQQFEHRPQHQQLAQDSETLQSNCHSQFYSQHEPQSQFRLQAQPTRNQYSSCYASPPWAATSGYFSNPNPLSRPPSAYSTAQAASSASSQGIGTWQHPNSNFY